MIDPSPLKRGLRFAAGAAALLAVTPGSALADTPENQPGWTANSLSLTTGIVLGYETAIDPVHRVLYAADANGASAQRQYVWDPSLNSGAGGWSDSYLQTTTQAATGKIASFSSATNSVLKNWSHTGLTGTTTVNGSPVSAPGGPLVFGNVNQTTGISTASNRLTGQYPYGVAVDHATKTGGEDDPTIVTVQTRTSTVAIYKSSTASNGVTDADVIPTTASGLVRARTPVVDSTRHKAYIVGYNATTGIVVQINTLTKAVEATFPVPGAVGLALDEATGLLYAGTYPGGNASGELKILDPSKADTSAPLDPTKNTQVVTKTITGVGPNARPGYDAVNKTVWLANSNTGLAAVSVVDVDPASSTYGTVLKSIDLYGAPNAVTIDGERGLAYVPTLGGKTLAVLDTDSLEYVTSVPTKGNALDADFDPKSGTVYVSSMSTNTTGDGQIQAIQISRPGDEVTNGKDGKDGASGPAGAAGAAGPAGAAGRAGKDGLNSLSLSLTNLKLVGSKVSFTAPGAGVLNVKVTSGGRTIATGKRTATKAGNYSLTLSKTAYGKTKLKAKGTVSGTVTATFTADGGKATVKKAIKAKLKR